MTAQTGDKASVTSSGFNNADLLKRGTEKEHQARDYARGENLTKRTIAAADLQIDCQGDQRQTTQQESDCIESERAN